MRTSYFIFYYYYLHNSCLKKDYNKRLWELNNAYEPKVILQIIHHGWILKFSRIHFFARKMNLKLVCWIQNFGCTTWKYENPCFWLYLDFWSPYFVEESPKQRLATGNKLNIVVKSIVFCQYQDFLSFVDTPLTLLK